MKHSVCCLRSAVLSAPSAPLRSLLFTPGNVPSMMRKGWERCPQADAIIPDLEDSVPSAEKENARTAVAHFIESVAQSDEQSAAAAAENSAQINAPLIIPRVNSLHSGLIREDLAAVVSSRIFGVTVPKVGSADDVHRVELIVAQLERERGLAEGTIRLLPWIETAVGVVNAYPICAASPRIAAVCFGADDFRSDMQIGRSQEAVHYAQSVISTSAQAAGVIAIDTPWIDIKDLEGLRRYVQHTKSSTGFKGMFSIHPSHVDVLNEGFSPTGEEIELAERVVSAFHQAAKGGRGSTSLDGKMIDVPVYQRHRKLLSLMVFNPKIVPEANRGRVAEWKQMLEYVP